MAGLDNSPELRQLITESYARFMQVILESRLSSSSPGNGSSSSAHRPQSSAFNLVMGNFGSITEKMEPWSRGVWEPMIIDILYMQQVSKGTVGQKMAQNVRKLAAQGSLKVALEASGSEIAMFLERWTVEFVEHTGASSNKTERYPGIFTETGFLGRYWRAAQYKVTPLRINERFGAVHGDEYEAICINVEKNLSILVRSLYSAARILPAHNLSRIITTTGNSKSRLVCRVLTAPPSLLESDKKNMMSLYLPPADCHFGHFRITVAYRRTVPIEEREGLSLPPHIIMDYVGKHQLKQLPGKKVGHVRSLPSAHCLPSFKASNLELQQPSTKERALKDGQSRENQTFDCPFAINEEIQDRKKAVKLLSVKSDVGVEGEDPQDNTSLGSLLAMLRSPESLRRTRENQIFSHEHTKTAADALKELKMYIDFKNNITSKCT